MKKLIVLVVFVALTYASFSQDKKCLYNGGMLFFQPGYTMIQNPHQDINTLGFGIGGMLRFYVKDHLTMGIIGGSQKTSYDVGNTAKSKTFFSTTFINISIIFGVNELASSVSLFSCRLMLRHLLKK